MYKVLPIMIAFLAATSLTFVTHATENNNEVEIVAFEEVTEDVKHIKEPIEEVVIVKSVEEIEVVEKNIKEPAEETATEIELTTDEIELIALVTMAEAEGEPEEGKRLVIDTILNRVDHERFPDTVYNVIYQKNQFTSMTNGRVDRCRVTEELCELVREELANRTNYDVIFFTANQYGKYGQPMFSVANHYFSSYQ